MPKKNPVTPGPTPVEAFVHEAKRANLPTPGAQEFVTPEIEAPLTVSYPREISSPMLVWQGKEAQDARDLETDAPPIYIQEKIDPRVLVENLRRTAAAGEAEPELTLFEGFDGLSDLDLVEFYRHDANWSNRMILGDSLQVMASLDSRERLRGKVLMLYMDPPDGIKFGSNWQASARSTEVRDGNLEDIPREVEQIKAFRDVWELGIDSYLSYLRDRLQVARDLLTNSGSLFFQIGDENVHLVRCLLDEVFGRDNFIAIIPFRKKTMPFGTTYIEQMADFILWYGKHRLDSKGRPNTTYRPLTRPANVEGEFHHCWYELPDRSRVRMTQQEVNNHSLLPSGARVYRLKSLEPSGPMESGRFHYPFEGRSFPPPKNGYGTTPEGMERLSLSRRLQVEGTRLTYIMYADENPSASLTAPWFDTVGADDKHYVVQTNTEVIRRCLMMTTDPGDLVLDPTCGSGTTAYVAEKWGRRWITIDTSRVALTLSRQRLVGALFPYYLLRDSTEGRKKVEAISGLPLAPAAVTNDLRQGFVYEEVPHVTLKSIANNPDVKKGMSLATIDAAIKRHSDSEMLVDRPYVEKRKVRVSGPFTVESLSPHRSLAFAPTSEPVSEREAAVDPDAPTFEQTILENLRAAGVQNGRRAERLQFEDVEPYAGTHIQAVGVRADAESGPARTGISIGPQYGTVDARFVKDAAREAGKAVDLDLLCVLGFAFDPQVLGANEDYLASDESFGVAAERALGRVPVLLVRMNADLLMGEELKKTGAGNLFTVFGEPDIDLRSTPEGDLVVELKGVDVFDPTTGDVRSDGVDRVALWMIDTEYNDESFFVRHCYFTGGQDPYKRLKQALKAEINEEAWASLNRSVSRPFARPSTGKLAVKVINDYGDEVVKVFDLNADTPAGFPYHRDERP
jgi:adenine-specific DNA-methyltransferase